MSEKSNDKAGNKSKSVSEKVAEQNEQTSPENDPAVDRGERIATGKSIARGGKSSGTVPGATPN